MKIKNKLDKVINYDFIYNNSILLMFIQDVYFRDTTFSSFVCNIISMQCSGYQHCSSFMIFLFSPQIYSPLVYSSLVSNTIFFCLSNMYFFNVFVISHGCTCQGLNFTFPTSTPPIGFVKLSHIDDNFITSPK
jgi:hypothetical protein